MLPIVEDIIYILMLKLSAWIDDLRVVCHSREQVFFLISLLGFRQK